ncbi:AAA family ATPase [Chitinimonas sp.]|uniref:AAA family ATPase n=1 Tax=Chitinimonas sp. TaxID=1934313 RepID=UPI002F939C99
MLDRLIINNFKAWRSLDIEFGAVTGLFGTNSSGKSSVLQFLLLLKQTKNATDRGLVLDFGGPEQFVNLGSFSDAVHLHRITEQLEWKVRWKLQKEISIANPSGKRTDILFSGSTISASSIARMKDRSLVSDRLEYSFGGYKFRIEPKKEGATEFDLTAESKEPKQPFHFVRNKARAWALPGPVKTHLFPDQAKTYFQNSDFLGVLESEYETMMDSIYYLGPLRAPPRREYPWSGASPSDVGLRGERAVEALLAATVRGETRNLGGRTHYKPFQEMIAYWLKELGLIHSFRIEEIGSGANLYRAIVQRDVKGPEALLTDVGFGVSQVLPALVLLHYVPSGSTVLMEQPEIHLHPAVQSGLADVILTVARVRKLQVIVESHSEHMLRRFQRRVAEERYSADSLKLYFCDTVDGVATLDNLELNMFGEIGNWPESFFGDEMTEISETRKAVLRRKTSARTS